MGPLRPNERQTLKSYYEVPPDVLADPEALLSWAREAIRAGQSSREPRMSLDASPITPRFETTALDRSRRQIG